MSAAQDEYNEWMRDKTTRTNHPEDDNANDDARSFLNLSDDDDDDPKHSQRRPRTTASRRSPDTDTPPRPSLSLGRHTIPTTRYGANTGPKGVISDAQHFRDSRRQHRKGSRSTSSFASHQTSTGGLSVRSQAPAATAVSNIPESSDPDEDEDGEEEDEIDEEFMDKWRSNRLREMQNGAGFRSKMHSRERGRRHWGSLAAVDGEGYLDAVDKSPAGTVVVVFIYDDYSQVSAAVEDCLHALARQHPPTRFVKLHYRDAEMEPAGVPALLAYRDGEKFAGLVPVIQEIPEEAELSAVTLEGVLRRHQILR